MTIMDDSGHVEHGHEEVKNGSQGVDSGEARSGDEEKAESMFSDKELLRDSKIKVDAPKPKEMDFGRQNRSISITPEDKISFLDAIVNNVRFTRDYSIFGGRVSLTVRSLTSDEVNAIAAWVVKKGSEDPSGITTGRYRKYLAAAQVAMLNGVEMPPLEEPLFETLGKDGKSVEPPGWMKRCAYWDGMSSGLFGAIMGCLADFDLRYSALCKEAEDSNFWNPDTP